MPSYANRVEHAIELLTLTPLCDLQAEREYLGGLLLLHGLARFQAVQALSTAQLVDETHQRIHQVLEAHWDAPEDELWPLLKQEAPGHYLAELICRQPDLFYCHLHAERIRELAEKRDRIDTLAQSLAEALEAITLPPPQLAPPPWKIPGWQPPRAHTDEQWKALLIKHNIMEERADEIRCQAG